MQIMRRNKSDLIALVTLLVFLAVVIGLFVLFFTDRYDFGWECGYYGQYNRVRHVIEDMPNVRIVRDMQHHDITLEDFGFLLEANDGEGKTWPVVMIFYEFSPEIHEWDKDRIRAIVQKEIDSQKDGPKRVGYFGFGYDDEE